jgi:hypothetical protein
MMIINLSIWIILNKLIQSVYFQAFYTLTGKFFIEFAVPGPVSPFLYHYHPGFCTIKALVAISDGGIG